MPKINLDKYYTPVKIAKYCINKFNSFGFKVSEVIEPAAGNGSFSLQIKDCTAYDIMPEHKSIIKQDFLKLEIPYKKGRLIIGNPPYGYGNKLAVKFYKKAYSICVFIFIFISIQVFVVLNIYKFSTSAGHFVR